MLTIADRANPGLCVRNFELTRAEFGEPVDERITFEGVASVVDTPYEVRDQWGTFTETIKRGAFNKTIKDGRADVALFVNHDTRALPLATRLDGSLTISASPDLSVRAMLNPLRPSVQEVQHAVTDGQARQMSIGFSVPKARDQWNDDFTERVVSEVNLSETSIVWRGASPTTVGAIRSLDEFLRSLSVMDMDEAEMKRAIRSMEHRFADAYSGEVSRALNSALRTRFNPSDNQGLYVQDHTDLVVVFWRYGFGSDLDGLSQLGYTLDGDGVAVLADSQPTPIREVTKYEPRDAASFVDRDRADRDRLDMKIANRPQFV